MFSKGKQIIHRLVLTKDDERNRVFNETVIKLIKKIEYNNLISEEESKLAIDDIDSCVFTFQDGNGKTVLVKYEFPVYFRGMYLSVEQGSSWNRVKKELQKELGKEYNLYNRVNYELKEKELDKIPKIIRKNPYFKNIPLNELYITLQIIAETNKYDEILNIVREIDEYIDCARIPFSPTYLDDVKRGFEKSKLNLINDLKEDTPAFLELQEVVKKDNKPVEFDDTIPEGVVEHCMDIGFFTSTYTKEMYGIPIYAFIRGQNELFADLDLLGTKNAMKGIGLEISFITSITNESNLASLWSCLVGMSSEMLKSDRIMNKYLLID